MHRTPQKLLNEYRAKLAAPDFRDELAKQADGMKIWVKTNRIPG